MAKISIIFILLSLMHCSYAQTYDSLTTNNIHTGFNADGAMFWDYTNSGFEVPAGSDVSAFFGGGVWLSYKNSLGIINGVAQTYFQNKCFAAGPVGNIYDTSYQILYNRVWKLTKTEVEYHKIHFADAGYVIPEAIANWPAQGRLDNGEAAYLAPFNDVDDDRVYEPALGDYPSLLGDENIFVMFRTNVASGFIFSPPFQAEVHAMFYENYINPTDPVNNAVFANFKIINRSAERWDDLRFGLWADTDLGCYDNDFIGCDTMQEMFYAYNGTVDDPDCATHGYEYLRTAIGVKYLSSELSNFLYYYGDFGVTGNPENSIDYYRYMRSLWKDDQHMTWGGNGRGGTIPANYLFPSHPTDVLGWSEAALGNTPSDRKGLGTTIIGTLEPDSAACVNLAFIFSSGDSSTYDHYTIVDKLIADMQYVQDYYDGVGTRCMETYITSVFEAAPATFCLHPNPAQDYIFIENIFSDEMQSYTIYDLKGIHIQHGDLSHKPQSAAHQIDVSSLTPGIYMLHIRSANGTYPTKFIKL